MTKRRDGVAFRYRNVILISLTICYIVQYIDRITMNTLIPFISRDLGLASRQIGLGSAIMMVFYGPSQWATGWLCDRIGSKKVLIFSVLSWSLLTGWMFEVRSITEWYIRMGAFGVLVGTEFVPSARLIVRWFPPRLRAPGAEHIFLGMDHHPRVGAARRDCHLQGARISMETGFSHPGLHGNRPPSDHGLFDL